MHLLILPVSGLIGLAVVTYLVAHFPINRTLRWKGDVPAAGREIAPTAGGAKGNTAEYAAPFDEHVIAPRAAAIHADLDRVLQQ